MLRTAQLSYCKANKRLTVSSQQHNTRNVSSRSKHVVAMDLNADIHNASE